MDEEMDRLLREAEQALEKLRRRLERGGATQPEAVELPPGNGYDATDWARRQRPEWEPRGRLMHLIAQERGAVSFARWRELGEQCGYAKGQGMNGFFAGTPPVVERLGDEIVLTERGWSAARYWDSRYGGRGTRA